MPGCISSNDCMSGPARNHSRPDAAHLTQMPHLPCARIYITPSARPAPWRASLLLTATFAAQRIGMAHMGPLRLTPHQALGPRLHAHQLHARGRRPVVRPLLPDPRGSGISQSQGQNCQSHSAGAPYCQGLQVLSAPLLQQLKRMCPEQAQGHVFLRCA